VQSSMLHGSETWPARKENEVALQQAEMRMVRSMCDAMVKDRVPSKELRDRLGFSTFFACVMVCAGVLCKVMKRLMKLPSEFWSRFVNVDDELDADDEDPFSPAAAAAPSQGV